MSGTEELTFLAQLVKDGKDFLLKKGTPKVLDPIKTSPFVVPTTTRKEAPTGNAPMEVIPLKAVTNRFPQVGGKPNFRGSKGHFQPHSRG